jgi:putative addiction module killer protein
MAADSQAIEVRKSASFDTWFRKLRDRHAKGRVVARLRRLTIGQFGDVRSIGGGIFELRIDYGPGYRVYCVRRELGSVLVLCAGVKGTQDDDIKRARLMWREWKD